MESFEDLGLTPELVSALAAEGTEAPTALQQGAIPVLRRGNNLVAQYGPGSGTLVAFGAPLLERIEANGTTPAALVLVPSRAAATGLAESLARLASATGQRVRALDAGWALADHAHILFATPSDMLDAVRASRIKLDGVRSVVVESAAVIQATSGLEQLETLLEVLPADCQKAVFSLPVTPEIEAFAAAHVRRAVHLPPRLAPGGASGAVPHRGELAYAVAPEPREEVALRLVERYLEEARHVLLFLRSEDRAADVADFIALHGFAAGAPGDGSVPVWVAVNEMEARDSLRGLASDDIIRVSVDVPGDADSLDRRHSGAGGAVLVLPRELSHLKAISAEAGYSILPFQVPPPPALTSALEDLREQISREAIDANLGPYFLVLEPLLERFTAVELAAAALALLDRRPAPSGPPQPPTSASRPRPPSAWVRLYVSLGARDGVGPGDLVGAITGEVGIEGSQVGKIEVRETFSLVEVESPVAEEIIKALNGTTVRGRSVRVDYDRSRPRERKPRRGSSG